ncbi:ParB N-terminal domain-containing protein [candidate division KSB1 bacterium]|nr:ParB N-terminal domain-containing protein [candidate division KSB1 bacterium]
MQIENIALVHIDLSSAGWDEFIFTYPFAPGPVKESIAAIGLQQPVVVTPLKKRFRLIIGVRRVLACRELGWQEIPAIVQPPQSREQLLWLSLHEKAGAKRDLPIARPARHRRRGREPSFPQGISRRAAGGHCRRPPHAATRGFAAAPAARRSPSGGGASVRHAENSAAGGAGDHRKRRRPGRAPRDARARGV